MPNLHVAVDAHNLLYDRRGIGVYVGALLRRWLVRDDVRLTLMVRRLLPGRDRAALTLELGRENFALTRGVPRDADVSWHPWNGTFFAPGRVPRVATVHDVVPFAYPAARASARRREQAPFLRSASADRVMTDSSFSRDEIVTYLRVDPQRIRVVALAADPRFTPGEAVQLPEALRDRAYVLAVAADDARKNLRTLADAHSSAFPEGDVALACVGGAALPNVIALRDVSFAVLRDLYRGAVAFAMPSLYEGFGIPPLEAMRCGTPVVASRAASLPEVCGDAALYVDAPGDANAWRDALLRVTGDALLRGDLREKGFARANGFSWNRTAEEALAVLREAAG